MEEERFVCVCVCACTEMWILPQGAIPLSSSIMSDFTLTECFFPQILTVTEPLDTDTWYTVILRNLSSTGDLRMEINGVDVTFIASISSGVDFSVFDGPLYIGGHPNVSAIQVATGIHHHHAKG